MRISLQFSYKRVHLTHSSQHQRPSQHHDDLPAQVSALVLAKDSVRQVLEVGLLGAAVDGRELGVRVHLRLLGLARLPLGRRQQEAVALQERNRVLAALVALLAPPQLQVPRRAPPSAA